MHRLVTGTDDQFLPPAASLVCFFSFLPKLHSIATTQSAVVPVVCSTTTWFQIHKTENGVDIDL